MAEIVFGFGTSHGPLLATPPQEWDLRANVDRKNKALAFGAGTYDFRELYELRKGEHFEKQNTIEVRRERDARCQHQLDALGEQLARVNPDVLIIVGDDHHEWFLSDIQPAFSVFHGKEVFNRALTPQEEQEKIANGGAYAMKIYHPPRDEIYPCPSRLAAHIVTRTVRDEFDTTALGEQPHDGGVPRQLGHSYGFIYRRVLKSRPTPLIPILVNTYYPPNQPTAKRCLEFGRAVARAIREWPGKERVAVAMIAALKLDDLRLARASLVIDRYVGHRVLVAQHRHGNGRREAELVGKNVEVLQGCVAAKHTHTAVEVRDI